MPPGTVCNRVDVGEEWNFQASVLYGRRSSHAADDVVDYFDAEMPVFAGCNKPVQ
jgi:hypothetical protein